MEKQLLIAEHNECPATHHKLYFNAKFLCLKTATPPTVFYTVPAEIKPVALILQRINTNDKEASGDLK